MPSKLLHIIILLACPINITSVTFSGESCSVSFPSDATDQQLLRKCIELLNSAEGQNTDENVTKTIGNGKWDLESVIKNDLDDAGNIKNQNSAVQDLSQRIGNYIDSKSDTANTDLLCVFQLLVYIESRQTFSF